MCEANVIITLFAPGKLVFLAFTALVRKYQIWSRLLISTSLAISAGYDSIHAGFCNNKLNIKYHITSYTLHDSC